MEYDLFEELVVYPGHPVTLAHLIVQNYPSLEVAQAKGEHFSRIEEDERSPGAAGHNDFAVQFLTDLDNGKSWEEVVAWADDLWARCDDQKHSTQYKERWRRGQIQADAIKPILYEATRAWLFPVEIEYADNCDPYKRLRVWFRDEQIAEALWHLGSEATLETVYAYLVRTETARGRDH